MARVMQAATPYFCNNECLLCAATQKRLNASLNIWDVYSCIPVAVWICYVVWSFILLPGFQSVHYHQYESSVVKETGPHTGGHWARSLHDHISKERIWTYSRDCQRGGLTPYEEVFFWPGGKPQQSKWVETMIILSPLVDVSTLFWLLFLFRFTSSLWRQMRKLIQILLIFE